MDLLHFIHPRDFYVLYAKGFYKEIIKYLHPTGDFNLHKENEYTIVRLAHIKFLPKYGYNV